MSHLKYEMKNCFNGHYNTRFRFLGIIEICFDCTIKKNYQFLSICQKYASFQKMKSEEEKSILEFPPGRKHRFPRLVIFSPAFSHPTFTSYQIRKARLQKSKIAKHLIFEFFLMPVKYEKTAFEKSQSLKHPGLKFRCRCFALSFHNKHLKNTNLYS